MECFALDVDEVPAAIGSRPDRLASVSAPQERFLRRIVLVDPVPGLPVLDALVPQVEQLVQVLMMPDVEQVIEVPGLAQEDGTPWRTVLREPRVTEQLVYVPVPQTVFLAHGRDDRGISWCHVVESGGSYWWMVGTNHTRRDRPQGFTASPGRYTNTGQRGLPAA